MTTGTLTLTQMTTFNGGYMTMGILLSPTEAYYVGYTTNVYDYSPTITYGYNVAYVMSIEQSDVCFTMSTHSYWYTGYF